MTKHRIIFPTLILGCVFPAFVILFGLLLEVQTTNISDLLNTEYQSEEHTVYSVDLSAVDQQEAQEMMFESIGCMIKVTSGENTLYEYGRDLADTDRMIGRVYVHFYLPESAYDAPIKIDLNAVEPNASTKISVLELCPHSDSHHYYLTNQNFAMPIALSLLATAFCIPIFLYLIDERRTILEGVVFGCALGCLSVMLLANGGHFLVFFSDQRKWQFLTYYAQYLFPAFLIFYFSILEKNGRLHKFLSIFSAVNFLFFGCVVGLTLTNTVKFYDLDVFYYLLVGIDALIGIVFILSTLKAENLSRVERVILNFVVLWAIIVILFVAAQMFIGKIQRIPHLDFLSVVAVIIFYLLCGLYVESAQFYKAKGQEKDQRIEELEENEKEAAVIGNLAKALSARYESIYIIDINTNAYQCYHESEAFEEIGASTSGSNFFEEITHTILEIVYPEDKEYFIDLSSRDSFMKHTENGKTYSFIYRIVKNGGDPVYRKIRAVRQINGAKEHLLVGIRDINEMLQREKEHENQHETMLLKERNHMKAILASSAGYMEVNLTQDRILDHSNSFVGWSDYPHKSDPELSYSAFMDWWAEHHIESNRDAFLKANDREQLTELFNKGILRSSTLFNAVTEQGEIQPCRQVAYLYTDTVSNDILTFTVTYDLTEQQRAEKEMTELKEKLQMSRLRVFTSQMQPHFLYNALGSIQEVVLDNPEYASDLIGDFSTHLRASIRAMASDDPIPFTQELENIRAYTAIEKMRFGDKLRIEFDIKVKNFLISPLSIQPLVENSIRHGIYERGKEGGYVRLSSRQTDSAWIVTVKDNGVGFDTKAFFDKKDDLTSSGLKNIIFRLKQVMGAEVQIESTVGVGTVVTVIIPKEGEIE